MKTQLEKVSNLGRKLNIEVPATLVKSTFDNYFKGVQSQADIKGFRKGKAPITAIKSMYGDKIKQDVIQELLQMGYSKALEEHKLEPISYPNFEFDEIKQDQAFSFSADFEIRPEVELKKYEGLEIQKEIYEFDDKRVDQVLENIRTSRATNTPVLENRPAQKGDIAVIDFDGTVDGTPLEGGKGTDHQLELGANQFIEGFEDGVIGMSVGGSKTLNLKFPSPYHAKNLEGKPVEFKVTLKSLLKKVLPELTDEFIQSLGGQGNLEDLKKNVREDLEQTEQKRIQDELRERVLKALVKENPVDVPASILKDQKENLIKDFENRMKQQGMTEAEFVDYVAKWDKDFEKTATEMIQSGFLIDAIGKKHNLNWTKEDLEKKFEEFSKQTGIELARVKEFYNRPESIQRLTYQITEDKVIGFLLEKAKVTETKKENIKK